jgi:tRNA 2-selenouridine synthase
MILTIEPQQLTDHKDTMIIDVRSPSEYSIGHIPGAMNIPLFDDEERALVGTRFNHAGKEAGFMLGLEIVGPKLSSYVKKLNQLIPVKSPVIIYCWRGGMRSNSMAWLFHQAGHEVMLIKGGYKAFRAFIRQQIISVWHFKVVGGMTGSGKTDILHTLKDLGQQVIDLEAIACHKGSVFGHMGQNQQPSNEQFEIDLWDNLRKLDPAKPIFIEDESRSIGKVSMPDEFYHKLQHSTMFLVEMEVHERVKRLVNEYGCFNSEELIENTNKLRKYLGGEAHQNAIAEIENGNLEIAAELLLVHYDKKYKESIINKTGRVIVPLEDHTGVNTHNIRMAELIIQKEAQVETAPPI